MTPYVLTLSCPDRPGIVHAVSGALAGAGGNITESQQFGDPTSGRFSMRVQVDVAADIEILRATLVDAVEPLGAIWDVVRADDRPRTLILVSREGHCLNDLLFRERSGSLPIEIVGVLSNHDDLRALATFYEVGYHHVPVTPDTRAAAEDALTTLCGELIVELVVLARYMQVLSPLLCAELSGRAINIHHSFLPSFAGAKPYHQAHERGVKLIGATAHYVTAALDEGPIIEQDVERVDHSHAISGLVATGRDLESRVLTRAVRWHAERRVLLDGRRTVVWSCGEEAAGSRSRHHRRASGRGHRDRCRPRSRPASRRRASPS